MNHADLQTAVEAIVVKRRLVPAERSLLVAISGIDGSGKGVVAHRLVEALAARGLRPYLVNLDAWHTGPAERFDAARSPLHFYEHAFRWQALWQTLIEPLRRTRSIHATLEVTRFPENDVIWRTYAADEIDVIMIEGIFLLKRELRSCYDLAFWVACSLETALRRALARNQEGAPPEQIVADYRTTYFPAQRIHIARDDPRESADGVIDNEHDD
jgi:uridine kinase